MRPLPALAVVLDQHHHRILSPRPPAAPCSPVAYAAAKAGVELFTKDLAAQAGPYGVRANCLAPETILTERNQREIPGNVQEEACRDTSTAPTRDAVRCGECGAVPGLRPVSMDNRRCSRRCGGAVLV